MLRFATADGLQLLSKLTARVNAEIQWAWLVTTRALGEQFLHVCGRRPLSDSGGRAGTAAAACQCGPEEKWMVNSHVNSYGER